MTRGARRRWLIAAALLGLWCAVQRAQAQEVGIDRPGGNLRPGFDLAQANPALCEQACASEASCRAWTYVKPGVQGTSARCWLKSVVPAPVQNDCCVSGVRVPAERHQAAANGSSPVPVVQAPIMEGHVLEAEERVELQSGMVCFGDGRAGHREGYKTVDFQGHPVRAFAVLNGFTITQKTGDNHVHAISAGVVIDHFLLKGVVVKAGYDLTDEDPSGSEDFNKACVNFVVIAIVK